MNLPGDKKIEQLIEHEIKIITKDILKIELDKIDININLGEFGFDSILLKDLGYKLGKLYDIDIPPIVFFERSTIKSLSDFLIEEYKDEVINKHKEQLIEEPRKINEIKQTTNNNLERLVPISKKYRNNKIDKKNYKIEKDLVAIIGISGIYPGSKDLEEFWTNLELEKDLITEIPPNRWNHKEYYSENPSTPNKTNVKWGGFINHVDKFDEKFFNISPTEAELMDPQHRLLMETTWKAIEDSGYKASELWGRNIGVFSGVQFSDYKEILGEGTEIKAQIGTGNAHSMLSNRISYLLNLKGPSESIDTACSSSLVAIHRAVKSIQSGESELAIAGGVSLIISPSTFVATGKLGVLSPDGKCKTFDKSANGYVRGEGVGTLILKPLNKAIEDNDNIYAVIKGTIESHGGRANSLTAPNLEAQGEMIIKVYEDAGLEPDTISYIEVHGTGTQLGDPIEVKGLKKAFSELANRRGKELKRTNYCGLGTVKTNIGHLEPASGMAGITKLILALKNKKIPKTLHLKEINPYIELEDSPFYIVDKTTKWERLIDEKGDKIPRRGGVSSFGFGGTYAHVILEEYETPINNYSDEPQVVILSAKNIESLKEYINDIIDFLNNNKSINFTELAYTLQVGREEMSERIAIVASGIDELRDKLHMYLHSEKGVKNLFIGTSNKKQELELNNKEQTINELISNKNLEQIAIRWVCGEEIDWNLLHNNKKIKRISLPTYPFRKNRHWIEKSSINRLEIVPKKNIPCLDNKLEQVDVNNNDEIELNLDEDIVTTDEKDISTRFQQDLINILSKALKINKKEIDLNLNLSEYGFDSVLFMKLTEEFNNKFSTKLMPIVFYEYQTLSSFKEYFLDEYEEMLNEYYNIEPIKLEEKTTKGKLLDSPKKVRVNNRLKNVKEISNIELNQPIAIIGMSGVMPKSDSLEEFWSNIEDEKDLITEIPKDRWDFKEIYGNPMREVNKTNIKWGGFMNEVDKFDPLFFGISPKEAVLMDPQQRIFLETVWKTVEDAGYSIGSISGTKTGVFVGVGTSDYNDLFKEYNTEIQAQMPTGVSHCILANRISYLLDLHGPSEPIDTACSSSLTAIHRAVESINLGHCNMAIAGGVTVIASSTPYIALSKSGMLSEDGRCKTFDKDANGYVRGEGAGAVLLKPLSKAVEDKDHIYGIIKGSHVNHGGHVSSLTTPNPNAQAEVIIKAWENTGVDPEKINYIEAHGTGTSLGDPIEINGLKKAFKELYKKWGKDNPQKEYCGIGSVKTNIGHLEAAAGIASLIKVLLALKHKKIPASINLKEVNPYIELEGSPFYIVDRTKEWDSNGNEPRRAGISSFGFGGTNAHVAIEEYIDTTSGVDNYNEPQIIVLSAKNKERLMDYAIELAIFLGKNKDVELPLKNIAYTLQVGRDAMEERLSIVVSTHDELKEKLLNYISNEEDVEGVYSGSIKNKKTQTIVEEDTDKAIENLIKNKDIKKIAQLWVDGLDINWNLLNDYSKYKKISLPTYPFERESYWLTDNKAISRC